MTTGAGARREWLHLLLDGAPVAALLSGIVVLAAGTHLVDASHDGEGAWIRWACLVGVSFYGWGSAIDRATSVNGRYASAPLRATWGLAASVFVGGLLNLLHLANARVLCGVVAVGLAAAVADLAPLRATRPSLLLRREARAMARVPGLVVAQVTLLAAVIVRLRASLRFVSGGYRWDDAPAYLAFLEQLAQTGSFAQPYSIRRLVALGGETVLQGLLFADRSDAAARVAIFDWGICAGLTALLLAAGPEARRKGHPFFRYVAAAVALTTFVTVWNAGAVFAGVLCFVGLWMTLGRLPAPGQASARELVPAALVAAAACSLRANYAPVAAMFVFFSYGFAIGGDRGASPWSRRVRELLLFGALTVLFLAPWMIDSFRSFHTPFFPLLQGDFVPMAGGFAADPPEPRRAASISLCLLSAWPFAAPAMLFFLLAGVLSPGLRGRADLRALVLAIIAGFALQIRALPLINAFGHARYVFGYALAGVVAVVAFAADLATGNRLERRRSAWFPIAVGAACALGLPQMQDEILKHYSRDLDLAVPGAPNAGAERAMQASVPAGATVMTFLDEPYLLDFRRNRILLGDFPGAVGPDGGLPVRGGPDAMARYLLAHDVRYVAYVRPDASHGLYGRADQEHNARNDDGEWIQQRRLAVYALALMDDLDALSRAHKRLFDASGLIVIDLGS